MNKLLEVGDEMKAVGTEKRRKLSWIEMKIDENRTVDHLRDKNEKEITTMS